MAKKKAVWFKFYPSDFEMDERVREMNDCELGLFLRCLNHSWINGGLPADLDRVARIMHLSRTDLDERWKLVGPCFTLTTDGRFVNPRQEQDRLDVNEYWDGKSRAGKASAAKRQQNGNTGPTEAQQRCNDDGSSVEHMLNDVLNTHTHTQTQTTDNRQQKRADNPATDSLVDAFERWIAEYPNAVKVDTALQSWLSLIALGEITEATLPEVFAGLQRWKESRSWVEDDGKYIPAPAVFLTGNEKHTGRMWKDRPPASADSKATRRGAQRSSEGVDASKEWVPDWKKEIA